MKWGKYVGKNLDHIPISYLKWLLTLESCPKQVKEYIKHYKDPLLQPVTPEEKSQPKHPNYYGLFKKDKNKN
jgi:hypothetical protein